MYLNKKVIVIVNAYSTSRSLVYFFMANGFPCIHVSTPLNVAPHMKKYLEIDTSLYLETIAMDTDDIETVVNRLRQYEIKAVLPGAESSVIIADQLASYFSVPRNNTATSLARRHKFHMIEKIKQAGLLTQKQYLATDVESLIDWYHAQQLKKIILKPPLSTGSDNVHVCFTEMEIRQAFQTILASSNAYGFSNQEVVAQEFIEGEEFVVNSVSLHGKHFITDCWKGTTEYSGDNLIHDYADKINPSNELVAYTSAVLNALDIHNGPAHTEIRLTNKGFYLIESGARLSGAIDASALTEAQGYNQLSCFAESIMEPQQFLNRSLSSSKHVRYIYFTPQRPSVLTREPNLQPFQSLASLHSVYCSLKRGDRVRAANFISDITGYAYLVSNDLKQLEIDYTRFKQIESQSLFA